MLLADRLNDLFEDFVHHVTDAALEGFQFLWGGLVLNCADGIIHLVVDTQEQLENTFGDLLILKQRSAPLSECVGTPRIITQGPDNRANGQVKRAKI